MHDLINFTGYHAILCLNGDLPDSSFFAKLNLPIIAADGAANSLFERHIKPTLIIGDLDSVHPRLLKEQDFLIADDQECSDYQKAMAYLGEQHLLPAIVVGINGGYLDHILNNINIFMDSNCLLYAPPIKGLVIREKSLMQLSLPVQTKISFLGMPRAKLSSQGLKWELTNTHLDFPGRTSCFNRVQQSPITIEVDQGAVLLLVYEQQIDDAGS